MAAIRKMLRSQSRANNAAAVALVVLFAALLALAAPARAHHSVPVNFDQSKEITITGKLTEAKWINPHSRFRLDVMQDDGKRVEWLVEMGAVNTMRRAGFEIEKFVVGDTLTIIGWPGRDRDRSMLLRTAVLKDGTKLTP
jgi:hypothetical protein